MSTPQKVCGDWAHLDEAVQEPRYKAIADLINRYSRGLYVLDVGCGMGTLAGHLPKRFSYFGVDPSSEAVNIAQGRGIAADVYHPDDWTTVNQWDCTVMSETLYYSRDPIGLLERFTRQLTADGILIVTIWQQAKTPTWRRRLAHMLDRRRPTGNMHCSEMVVQWLSSHGHILQSYLLPRPNGGAPWRVWAWIGREL